MAYNRSLHYDQSKADESNKTGGLMQMLKRVFLVVSLLLMPQAGNVEETPDGARIAAHEYLQTWLTQDHSFVRMHWRLDDSFDLTDLRIGTPMRGYVVRSGNESRGPTLESRQFGNSQNFPVFAKDGRLMGGLVVGTREGEYVVQRVFHDHAGLNAWVSLEEPSKNSAYYLVVPYVGKFLAFEANGSKVVAALDERTATKSKIPLFDSRVKRGVSPARLLGRIDAIRTGDAE